MDGLRVQFFTSVACQAAGGTETSEGHSQVEPSKFTQQQYQCSLIPRLVVSMGMRLVSVCIYILQVNHSLTQSLAYIYITAPGV